MHSLAIRRRTCSGAPEMLDMALGADSLDAPPHAAQICSIYMAADPIKAVMRQLVGQTGGRRQPNLAAFCRDCRLCLG
jgi:hypothetical protein